MRYFLFKRLLAGMALSAGVACIAALAQTRDYSGIGRAPTPEELKTWSVTSGPSGKDLPAGKGTAKEGERIYLTKCVMCHGRNLEGIDAARGSGSFFRGWTLASENTPSWDDNPFPGAAKYYAYATTLWNAVRRSMPLMQPGTLTDDEAYAVVAYILFKSGVIQEDAVMDRERLPKVEMPNRHGFVPDKLEDIPNIQKRGCFKTYGVCP